MLRDIRTTPAYREAEALFTAVRQPGTGQVSAAAEIHGCPTGRRAIFSGVIVDALEGTPPTRICEADLSTGHIDVLTWGPNSDRAPRFAPDGRLIAFLSDRNKEGDYQLHLLDEQGRVRCVPCDIGWIEYLHWSPSGSQILLGVAGHGADIAGGQGAVATSARERPLPGWTPSVWAGDKSHRWRSAWIYDLENDRLRRVTRPVHNVWESAWCGNQAIVAVAAQSPCEGSWYRSKLSLIDTESGECRHLYTPRSQIGFPSASPSGKTVALIEGVSSDRWFVAGELLLIHGRSGAVRRVDCRGIDVTCLEWRSERELLVAGHRGLTTVIALCDADSGGIAEIWSSDDLTTAGIYATVSGIDGPRDCVLVGEGYRRAPEIAVIHEGRYRTVRSLDLGFSDKARVVSTIRTVTWRGTDGLEIQGSLLQPDTPPPHPLVMYLHGGPVWHWRPNWLGRGATVLMLLARGCAVFFPNPRGSSGRGQDFARLVIGDMGGGDASDCLAGLGYLADLGLVDTKHLGVTGTSYGGFMTSWLITQDPRLSAAVSIAPVTSHVTQHLISNVPEFVSLFLADSYTNAGGAYFRRSPAMYAHRVKAPTLNICGRLDRCTPPEEAMQFHSALLENHVKSELVVYPEEGHGIGRWPAAIDFSARVVGWFEEHLLLRASV